MTAPAIGTKGPFRHSVRKEKPLPPAKPQEKPPAPSGIRAPGNGVTSSGMICPGSGR
jgi:hypothetical protein